MLIRTLIRYFFLITLLLISTMAEAQTLIENRPYEPVIVEGKEFPSLNQFEANTLHLYAYNASNNTWTVMPYQIDESLRIETEKDTSWTFFQPDTDPQFDGNDQLVFLIRDMGDKADPSDWVDHPDAEQRVEIELSEPDHPEQAAYAYLYISSTLNEPIPTPYSFDYNMGTSEVNTVAYSLNIDPEYGFIDDMKIKSPLGNGINFLDRQKFRFVGVMAIGFGSISFGKEGIPAASELNLVTITDQNNPYYFHDYTKTPVVRLIREVRAAIQIERVLDEISFRNEIMFYPYSAALSGGAVLSEEEIREATGTEEDVYIEVNQLRQSWDLNASAVGMKFYNENNNGLVVDGAPDNANTSLSQPNRTWTMVSGSQGTFFNYITLKDTSWENANLYYYDNLNGGQGDLTDQQGQDTGDGVSYGDHGITLKNNPSRTVDLSIEMGAYFMHQNMTKADGELLFHNLQNPVIKTFALQERTAVVENLNLPETFVVKAAYPNPFNGATRIQYSLDRSEFVTAIIHDSMGRTVKTMISEKQPAGQHQLTWHGLNDNGQTVSSGLYFFEIRIAKQTHTQKLLFIQ